MNEALMLYVSSVLPAVGMLVVVVGGVVFVLLALRTRA